MVFLSTATNELILSKHTKSDSNMIMIDGTLFLLAALSDAERLEACREMFHKRLPSHNFVVLKYILSFLVEVSFISIFNLIYMNNVNVLR